MSFLKEFWFRMKIFLWYLITEPFRQIYGIMGSLSEALNKTIYWIYYMLTITIVALILGKRYAAAIMMIILIVFLLIWEWRSGFFMHRYREKQKRRIKKIMNNEGGIKNGK